MAKQHSVTYKREVTAMSLYKKYKAKTKSKVNRYDYIHILRAYNKALFEKILDNQLVNVHLLGQLRLVRVNRNLMKPKKNINFKASKEHGFTVYHTEGQFWVVQWINEKTVLKNKKINRFLINRVNKKIIAERLKEDPSWFYSFKDVSLDRTNPKIKNKRKILNETNEL